jgi:hypothetical protein
MFIKEYMIHGLDSFEAPSPRKRAYLGPDTQVDLHCRRRGGSMSVMVHTGHL